MYTFIASNHNSKVQNTLKTFSVLQLVLYKT